MKIEQLKEVFPEYNGKISKNCVDLTGRIFGRLTVLYRYKDNASGGQAQWVCKCSCGNFKVIRGSSLRTKHTTSCGCLTYENASRSNIKDLTNQRFGKLTVLEDTKKRKNHRVIWKCKCDCGNIVERDSNTLIQGDSYSCGRCNQSKTVILIESLLKENNIPYETEKTFPNLVGKNKIPLRYDFYLPTLNRLIEFDGIQHYKERTYFKDSLEDIQKRDLIKNKYALNNKIDLVRIPYWKSNITIETLLSNNFLVGE